MVIDGIIAIISNPSISAILGAIAGATASYIPVTLLERKKHNRLKNNIKKFIRVELEEIQNLINRCLEEGEKKDNRVYVKVDSGIGRKLNDVMTPHHISGQNYFVFTPTNYPKLTGELKATIFEDDIDSLEYIYRKIHELKLIRPSELMTPDYFEEEKCINIIESLTQVISELKK